MKHKTAKVIVIVVLTGIAAGIAFLLPVNGERTPASAGGGMNRNHKS